jgi:predicted metal-dependent peptidase
MMHEILHVVLQHCIRGEDRDHERMNIACDIVVNSNILLENNMDLQSITLRKWGESMHLAPDGKEGHRYTAEQVYEMLPNVPSGKRERKGTGGKGGAQWDDHSHWSDCEEDPHLKETWIKRFADACEAISIREKLLGRDMLPRFAKRMWEKLQKPQTDWRTVLNEFVQQEVNDYSFSPPDRRFSESPFFLPDFSALGDGDTPVNILFMMDTSASVTDGELAAAYSEIKGAIEQFGGKLVGWLGFFDAGVVEPCPFADVEDVLQIKPVGGGGTDFHIVFAYVRDHMQEQPPACIIMMTDGYAPFPKEEAACGIPVLWLLTNEDVTPPWGKIARIRVETDEA